MSLLRISQVKRSLLPALFLVLLLGNAAAADELQIVDQQGGTKLLQTLPRGSSSSVTVTVVGETAVEDVSGIEVTLKGQDGKDFNEELSALCDRQGTARFDGVRAGKYEVTLDSKEAIVGSVTATTSERPSGSSADQAALDGASRSMYAVGASAVAGVVGIVAATSGGSSGSSSRSPGALGFVSTDGAALGGPSEGSMVTASPKPAAQGFNDPTRPPVFSISPPPPNGKVNPTPNAFNPKNPGTGSNPETPQSPGNIIPAPPNVPPVTPAQNL